MGTYKVGLTRRKVIEEHATVNVMAKDKDEALRLALDVGRNEPDVEWNNSEALGTTVSVLWKNVEVMK